jgi:hypothetical protein
MGLKACFNAIRALLRRHSTSPEKAPLPVIPQRITEKALFDPSKSALAKINQHWFIYLIL